MIAPDGLNHGVESRIMHTSLVARYFRTLYRNFWESLVEDRFDRAVIGGTVLWILVSGYSHEWIGFEWDLLVPLAWGISILFLGHAYSAARIVIQEIRNEREKALKETNLLVLMPSGENASLPVAPVKVPFLHVRIYGMFVILAAMCFCVSWLAWRMSNGEENKKGLIVSFRTEYIDMSRSIDHSAFWILYKSAFGDAISPVALVAFMDVTNPTRRSITVSTYTMAIKTESCGWTYLTPIDTRAVDHLLWGLNGLGAAGVLDMKELPYPSFNYLWTTAISRGSTENGFLLFDTNVQCQTPPGTPIELKLDITDSTGRSFPFSFSTIIQGGSPPSTPSTTGERDVATLVFTGWTVNAFVINSQHYRDLSGPTNGKHGVVVYSKNRWKFFLKTADGAFNFHPWPTPPS